MKRNMSQSMNDPITAGKLQADIEADATQANKFKVGGTRLTENDNTNVNFPVQLGQIDRDDEKYGLVQRVVDDKGVIPKVGQVIVGDEYLAYLTRKMKQTQLAEFETFVMENVDLSTPEKQAWAYQTFPFILQKKLAEIDYQAQLQKRAAEIQVRGVKSMEDMEFLYMLKQNIVKISDKPVHMLATDAAYNGREYSKGMFSILAGDAYVPPRPTALLQNKLNFSNLIGAGGPQIENQVSFPTSLMRDYLRAPAPVAPVINLGNR